ncbi:LIP-domain-containing protein [Hesseltinella vesiculosa]|uniref:LIP-domain-containing protein n=1 Tax=Hesseltinella vesiculosa TaxID=101127 RepID=A0A1X2G990_9FUNG|nr:LIP-domain-containing protein [Hesseltinella vesiculosa]
MKLQHLLAPALGLAWAVTQVASVPVQLFKRGSVPPSQDPFYQAPSNLATYSNGAIIRSREFGYVHNIAGAYQLLYRTTDVLGNAMATVTTVLKPYNANTGALVSYQFAEDSPWMDCAPSYSLDQNSTTLDQVLIEALLYKGYYVMASDYEGPNSVFTCGGTSGNGVLDGVRAALASSSLTGISSSAAVQLWGYSGGALATGWAVQSQKTYAPELNIIGAAMGGTPVNINATLNAVNGGSFSELIPAGILGLSQQYPDLLSYVFSAIKPEYQQLWQSARKQCLHQMSQFSKQDMAQYFNRPDYLNADVVTKYISASEMGHLGTPTIPLHLYHAIHDEVVPYANAKNLVQTWCAGGANIQFTSDELSEHLILAVTGGADAFNFIVNRFSGAPLTAGCTFKTTLTSALDSGALSTFGSVIFDELKTLLNVGIGLYGS